MMKNDKQSYSYRGREGRLLGEEMRGRCAGEVEEDEKDEERGNMETSEKITEKEDKEK